MRYCVTIPTTPPPREFAKAQNDYRKKTALWLRFERRIWPKSIRARWPPLLDLRSA